MSSLDQLKQATHDFFNKHWDFKSNKQPPEWSEPWQFFHEVPFNAYRGCYVHVREGGVVYSGVAMNSGLKGYENDSLGARISKYWLVDETKHKFQGKTYYKPSPSLLERGVDTIYTLGFPKDEQEYLVLALEYFLIQKLDPKENVIYNNGDTST